MTKNKIKSKYEGVAPEELKQLGTNYTVQKLKRIKCTKDS